MRKYRSNVFETNSSSTHSICVTKNNILDDKQKYVYFKFGEFGWERDELDSVGEKASYLYTAIMDTGAIDLLDKLKAALDNNGIAYKFEDEPTKHHYYIDHSEELGEFLTICEDEDMIMRYLFSSESFIITGNDNDEEDVDIRVGYPHEEYYKGN